MKKVALYVNEGIFFTVPAYFNIYKLCKYLNLAFEKTPWKFLIIKINYNLEKTICVNGVIYIKKDLSTYLVKEYFFYYNYINIVDEELFNQLKIFWNIKNISYKEVLNLSIIKGIL